jgi:hypothetical protein
MISVYRVEKIPHSQKCTADNENGPAENGQQRRRRVEFDKLV